MQWIQRQLPPHAYPYPQSVYIQHRSGGGAKGCLIASGIGFLLLGLLFVITLIGFHHRNCLYRNRRCDDHRRRSQLTTAAIVRCASR